jgi:AraC family transcriptional regulator, arabinose operon regulatory protein
MDRISISLCSTLMTWFDGLAFLTWGRARRYANMHERVFADYWGIQYNNAGPLAFALGGDTLERVEGPHAFLTWPGERFRYGSLPGDAPRDHAWICFRGPRVARWARAGLLDAARRPTLSPVLQPGLFIQGMEEAISCLASRPARHDRAVHALEGLLLQLAEQEAARRRPGRLDAELDALGAAMDAGFGDAWDFDAEARRLCVSSSHFRRLFNERLGCAPGRYLLLRRLERAAGLLRDTDESVRDIAAGLGFCDVYYFTRQFTRRFHLPPARYRREHAG